MTQMRGKKSKTRSWLQSVAHCSQGASWKSEGKSRAPPSAPTLPQVVVQGIACAWHGAPQLAYHGKEVKMAKTCRFYHIKKASNDSKLCKGGAFKQMWRCIECCANKGWEERTWLILLISRTFRMGKSVKSHVADAMPMPPFSLNPMLQE